MRGSLAVLLSREGPPSREGVRRMLASAPHRGDDLAVEASGSVALGVSNDAAEPNATVARDGDFVAAFVGALDNHAELLAGLGGQGGGGGVPSPAALLLAGFRLRGPAIVRELRGSFAGVVSDGVHVFCFRDHFGTRSLFFHDGPRGFHAASEVKQVLAGAAIPREPDLDHLHRSIYGSVGSDTAFRGVERVPGRAILRAGPTAGGTTERFWDPDAVVESASLSLEDAIEGTVEAVERAVRRMLSGRDVILLSGGLDSPALAACGVAPGDEPGSLRALTAAYPSAPSVDETEWTQLAADQVGVPLRRYEAEAGAMEDVDRWVRLVDSPVVTLSMPESAEAYREARGLGGRTVLTGEIAEMLFESRMHLLPHLLWRGRLRSVATTLRQRRRAGRGRRSLIRDLVRATVAERWLPTRFRPPAHHRLRGLPPWVDPRMLLSYSDDTAEGVHPRHRWTRAQTAPFQGPSTGFEADEICAASCGVEVRRPFADVDLWEYVLSLPAEVKFPDPETKPLLRRAMRGKLPDALIDRKDKTYFDEFHLRDADYATLGRLLVGSPHRVDGIDYALLEEHLARGDMTMYELSWAQNVARIHAFLDQW